MGHAFCAAVASKSRIDLSFGGLYSPPHCPVGLQTGLWLKIAENDGITYWTKKKKLPNFPADSGWNFRNQLTVIYIDLPNHLNLTLNLT